MGENSATKLKRLTYMVRHNPSCPSPFEIRTGGHAMIVDAGERRNFVSYGKTFEEAARKALDKIEDDERNKRVRRAQAQVNGIVWG